MKSEEWFPFGSSQQSQGVDIIGAHVTDSGKYLQSSILTSVKNILLVVDSHLCPNASMSNEVSHSLLPLSM
jgi:hypothetical protein